MKVESLKHFTHQTRTKNVSIGNFVWCLAVVTSICPKPVLGQVLFSQHLNRDLTDILDAFAQHEGFSGVALVAVGDSVVLHEARGMASVELQVPLRADHRLLLASVSKSFTAAAVLRLVDKGNVSLHASILDYLPRSELDPRITVHHLLTHTSGLARDLLPGTEHTRREHFTTTERVAIAQGHGLRFNPGERFAYSSAGYVVLGALIESVTNQPLADALDSLVFRPLGMDNTGLELDAALIPRRASRYQRLLGVVAPAVYEDPTFGYGAGSVSGTAGDLLKFVQALLDDGFLSATSRQAMVQNHVSGQGYGMRPFAYTTGPRLGGAGGTGFGYDGGTAGVASTFNVLVDHRTVVIVLSNLTPFAVNRLSNPLVNTALGYDPPDSITFQNHARFYTILAEHGRDSLVQWAMMMDGRGERHLLPSASDLFQDGYGLYLHHRLDEADTVLRALIELAPSTTAWVVLGRVLLAQGATIEGCAAFDEAVRLRAESAGVVPAMCRPTARLPDL